MAKIEIFPRLNGRVRRDDPEPSIAELLDDPVTHAVMRRDGVTRRDIVETIEVARLRLAARAAARASAVPELCCA